jgi:hypothetical protein
MANMHVRGRTARGYSVVCHVAIPAGNNAVGLSWRTAYARSVGAPLVTVLPDGDGTLGTIGAAEKTAVTQTTPTLAEVLLEFQPPDDWAALTGAQQQARLDDWYAVALAEWQANTSTRLGNWGYVR